MLAFVRGTVSQKTDQGVVIDVQGLGYQIQVTTDTKDGLKLEEVATLYVYEYIRDDSYDLYGFPDQPTKQLFELLLSVSGLGPKMAQAVMDLGQPDSLKTAIAAGDVAYLMSASGVGKRLAERVVVDLKDKVGVIADVGATDFLASASDEAVEALTTLGFSAQDARLSLKDVSRDLPTEERVKQALQSRSN